MRTNLIRALLDRIGAEIFKRYSISNCNEQVAGEERLKRNAIHFWHHQRKADLRKQRVNYRHFKGKEFAKYENGCV